MARTLRMELTDTKNDNQNVGISIAEKRQKSHTLRSGLRFNLNNNNFFPSKNCESNRFDNLADMENYRCAKMRGKPIKNQTQTHAVCTVRFNLLLSSGIKNWYLFNSTSTAMSVARAREETVSMGNCMEFRRQITTINIYTIDDWWRRKNLVSILDFPKL